MLLLVIGLVIVSLAYLGVFSSFKNTITGRVTKGVDINITLGAGGGNPPNITSIFNNSVLGGTLNEGPSSTTFIVNFTVLDLDGVANLNSATAAVNLTKSGETTRYNWTCAQYQSSGNVVVVGRRWSMDY